MPSFASINVATFDGRLRKNDVQKIVNMIKRETEASPTAWEHTKGIPVEESKIVQQWEALLVSLPFEVGDVLLSAGSMFQLPTKNACTHAKPGVDKTSYNINT